MAGAPQSYSAHPFFANGHGEQCIRETGTQVQSVGQSYVLPPGVHFVTIQEAGRFARLTSTEALRAVLTRGFDPTRMVPKPPYSKSENVADWCRSKYMRFKHELARAFDVVEAVRQEAEEDEAAPLLERAEALQAFLESDLGGSPLSFEELVRKNGPLLEDLCNLYDERIHIRYPGDEISDNTFTGVSYEYDIEKDQFVGLDGASGLIDGEEFMRQTGGIESDLPAGVAAGNRARLTAKYTLADLDKDPSILLDLYSASVYPTQEEVRAALPDPAAPAQDRIAELDATFKIPLRTLIPRIVKQYGVSEESPIVVYYPLCRVFRDLTGTERQLSIKGKQLGEKVSLERSRSLQRETTISRRAALEKAFQSLKEEAQRATKGGPGMPSDRVLRAKAEKEVRKSSGGRRRKTFRKKKLRKQTRRRRQ